MSFIKAFIFRYEEDCPFPEFLVPVMGVKAAPNGFAFTNIDLRKQAIFGCSDQDVYTRSIRFRSFGQGSIARSINDYANASPV